MLIIAPMFWDKLKKKFLKIKWVYTPLQESFLYQPKWIAKKTCWYHNIQTFVMVEDFN